MVVETIKQVSVLFFEKMLIQIESLDVVKEADNIYYVKIKTPDSWLLIWYMWKALEDVRWILKLLITSKLEEKNIILHLEVNDYISKKEDRLYNFISKKIEIVKTWKEVILPYYNPYERKKIHNYISELNDSEIFTKSIWDWSERRLHICKKSKNLTIDMDGIDI